MALTLILRSPPTILLVGSHEANDLANGHGVGGEATADNRSRNKRDNLGMLARPQVNGEKWLSKVILGNRNSVCVCLLYWIDNHFFVLYYWFIILDFY